MKTKFLLPVLAILFATGMSFTTAKIDADPNNDYIFRNGNWHMISEVSCTTAPSQCLITVNPEGLDYVVFDSQNFNDRKSGNGESTGEINL